MAKSKDDLEVHLRRILTFRAEGAVATWRTGRELAVIHKDRLWCHRVKPDGSQAYRSFAHFCSIELGLSGSYAIELIDVAREFSETDVINFGVTKLVCWLRAPKAAKSIIMRKMEAGASERDIKAILRAIKVQRGLIGVKRITGRKIVGGRKLQEEKIDVVVAASVRLLARLAMAMLGKRSAEHVTLTMSGDDARHLRTILRGSVGASRRSIVAGRRAMAG